MNPLNTDETRADGERRRDAAVARVDRAAAHATVSAQLELAARRAGGDAQLVLGAVVSGSLEYVAGATDDHAAPRTLDDLGARIDSIADATAEAAAMIVEAVRATHESIVPLGDDRFVALLAAGKENEARLTEARAVIERRYLDAFSGQVSIAIVWVEAPADRIGSAEVADRLEAQLRRRRALPFLDALANADAFGPFAAGSTIDNELPEIEPYGPPCVVVVRRSLYSSVAGSDLATRLAREVEQASFARSVGEGCGFASADGELLAGPLGAVLGCAFSQTADELRDASLAIEATNRGAKGLDAALTRAVATCLERSRGISMFGASIAPTRVEEAFRLGTQLAPLADKERATLVGLLELAIALDAGMDRAPLMLLSRWRAQAHALSARLGMNERALRKAPEHEDATRSALRALIGEFPKWFDSGAARVPLRIALALHGSQPEVCSA